MKRARVQGPFSIPAGFVIRWEDASVLKGERLNIANAFVLCEDSAIIQNVGFGVARCEK